MDTWLERCTYADEWNIDVLRYNDFVYKIHKFGIDLLRVYYIDGYTSNPVWTEYNTLLLAPIIIN